MKTIIFRIHFCSMASEKFFSDKIRVHGPLEVKEIKSSYDECAENNIVSISDLINYIKSSKKEILLVLDDWGMARFSFENIYVRYGDYLLGLQENKKLEDMFTFFNCDMLELDYLFVPGGASIHCNGYLFTVHPAEDIHRHLPHVHVSKAGKTVRYTLDTLEKIDEAPREFLRDEKKVIFPALNKNLEWLRKKWNLYMNGYIPPAEDENGMQFCRES